MSRRSPTAGVPAPPEAVLSRGRLWAFRVTAMTIVPLLFFGVLEIGLRLARFGYEPRFVVSDAIEGQAVRRDNPDFSRRFFPPPLFRSSHPFVFPPAKARGTYRIFVLGESAAMGDPAPAFGLGRVLEVMLRDRYPDRRFEVVNAAVTAINSHAVRDIAANVAREEPDLFLVYMGNNEVVGPYGAGTVFSPLRQSLAPIRAQLYAKRLRVGQLADRLGRIRGGNPLPRRWQGMEMFLGHEVRATDPGLAGVYRHFRRNLEDIVDAGAGAGAKVLLCTVGTNVKDSAPFASRHRRDLSPADETAWQAHFAAGLEHESGARWQQALAAYARAQAIDDQHAELAFRQGRCRFALQEYQEAVRDFHRARDLDALRFRADSTINRLIREVGAARDRGTVALLDAEEVLRRASPHGAAGEELFYEHVHLNFNGNYQVAAAALDHLAALCPCPPARAGRRCPPTSARGGWASRTGTGGGCSAT